MDATRAVIRYSFNESEVGGPRVSGLITVSLRSAREECALNYLVRRHPKRHDAKLIEVIYL